jgi:signal transduction histidine kinase
VKPDRWSLRRRLALSLAGMSLLGYVAFNVAWYLLDRSWSSVVGGSSYACLSLPGISQCSGFETWPTRFIATGLAAGALAGSAWVWWALAAQLLRPLRAAADAVRRVGPQNLGQRVAMTGATDELKGLTDALDEALDRIAAGYESQRRFASNASHELRTPLALQRLLTEVAMDDPATSQDLRRLGELLLRANERSERLIEGLLVLAESDRGLQGKVPVRLDELTASVLDSHLEIADRNKVILRRGLAERFVPGDLVLLERLVSNLVSNAIAYNHPGGWVEVVVAGEPAITVSNTGQSVPAEMVSSLFEPFRRLTADRIDHSGGSGLGLAVVRSITTAHNGTVQARPRADGGLIVEISLPHCPPPEVPRTFRTGIQQDWPGGSGRWRRASAQGV